MSSQLSHRALISLTALAVGAALLVVGSSGAVATPLDPATFAKAVGVAAARPLERGERMRLRAAVGRANASGRSTSAARGFAALGSTSVPAARRRVHGERVFADFVRKAGSAARQEPWKTALPIVVGSQAVIAGGRPALTKGAVDAYVAMYRFTLTMLLGQDDYEVPASMRRKLENQLRFGWPRLHPRQKANLANLPMVWLKLRSRWASTPSARRRQLAQRYRTAWMAQAQRQASVNRAPAPRGRPARTTRRWTKKDTTRHMTKKMTQNYVFQNMMKMNYNSFATGFGTTYP